MGSRVLFKARVYPESVAKVYELRGSSRLKSTEKCSPAWRTWLFLDRLEAKV